MKVTKLTESVSPTWKELHILDEDVLVEGPLSWLKDKIDPKGAEARAKKRQEKEHRKIQNKKIPIALALDYDQKTARSTFYINHNYKKPYTQAGFHQWIEQQEDRIKEMKDDPEGAGENGKKAQEEKKFLAARTNAIVVDEHGYYARRGGEYLYGGHIEFIPGNNDKIANGYFLEPYKYSGTKTSGTKPSSGKTGASSPRKPSTKITPAVFKKFQQLCLASGTEITDLNGKKASVTDIKKPEDLINYKVTVGSAKIEANKWIAALREKRLL